MNRLAVLGQPIAHSLSPAMHTAAFAALGIDRDWSYEAIELSPEDFDAGVARLVTEGYVGANVTIPHKAAALAAADEASEAASQIGAANTLSFTPAGIRADNTDAAGLLAALPVEPAGARALVLGAGGAGRAAAWALKRAGAEVTVHNRTTSRALDLARDLGVETIDPAGDLPLERFDVLVNTTSIGLSKVETGSEKQGSGLKDMRLSADQLSDRLVVVDLVYGDTATELTAAARRGGASVVDGLEILVLQGAESFRIWTGLEPPLNEMRRAVQSERKD